ncbi:MAG: T9SS type A sorting domain-containing protein [Flavobacteriales bacterium]
MNLTKSSTAVIAFILLLSPLVSVGQDTVSLMNYNILNYPGSTPERHQHLRKIVHYSEPDLVLANEVIDRNGVETLLDSSFNRFGTTHYDTARFIDGTDTDNMLFYNSDLFGLASQDTIQTQLRKIDHYKVFYKDTGLGTVHNDTSFLHLFALHLKASSSNSDEVQRAQEASQMMGFIDQLPDSAEVIAAGDYNIYYPTSEPAWDTLKDASYTNRLYDPLATSGDWHNDSQYSAIHTQSTQTSSCQAAPGGATGGMDDRFDLNLVDSDVLNGTGRFELIDSSYHALGQDGQHFNECITASPMVTVVPDSVVQSLFQMSDHLPVLMDLHFDCEEGVTTTSDSTSICQGDTAWVGGNPYTTEGWAYDTLYSELSCNSIQATYVDVQPVDTNVVRSNDTLYAQASNATSYQWIDCSDNTAISGASDSSFHPSMTGNYAVAVSQNGCTDTSGCHSVLIESIRDQNGKELAPKLYPSPGKDRLNIQLSSVFHGKVRVMDLQGRALLEQELSGSSDLRFNTSGLAPGLYLVEIRDPLSGLREVRKWTKSR